MRVVIAGGGMTGRRLIARLAADRHEVVVIDLSRDVCEWISSKLGVSAVHGNATDVATLEEAEIDAADAAVALTGQSADNLAFSLLAKAAGASRLIVRMMNPKYRQAYERAGVTSIIDVAGLFLEQLLLEIERPQIHEVMTFAAGQGSILRLTIPEASRAVGRTVSEVVAQRRWPDAAVVAGIYREETGQLVIPHGDERLRAGDEVLVCAAAEAGRDAIDALEIRRGLSALLHRKSAPDEDTERTQEELDTALEPKPSADEGGPIDTT
jgi:trk system potassium uptake protein